MDDRLSSVAWWAVAFSVSLNDEESLYEHKTTTH